MKAFRLVCVAVLLSGTLQAFEPKPVVTNFFAPNETVKRRIVVKMNVSPLIVKSLAFMGECAISNKFSVGLGYTAVLQRSVPQLFFSSNIQFSNPTFKGKTITPEFRWFPFYKKKKQAPSGFYMAGYVRYANYSFSQNMTYYDTNTGVAIFADAKHTYKGTSLGAMLGFQAISKGGFTFDWWILGGGTGLGSYTFSLSNLSADFSQNQQYEAVQQYLSYYKDFSFIGDKLLDVTSSATGISAKAKGLPMFSTRIMGFCFGYAF